MFPKQKGWCTKNNPLLVFYSQRQSVANNSSFSPSAGKPALVAQDWLARGLPIQIQAPAGLKREDFYRAHDPTYANGVLDLRIPNGFYNRLPEVAESLPFTSGSLYAAAAAALKERVPVASLSSGFHHAHFDSGGGFCTFNGLLVASLKLREEGQVRRLGILDLDFHYGDGTQEIIRRLDLADWIVHRTGLGHCPSQAEGFLDGFQGLLEDSFEGMDLVLYQAGADAHVDDPLGGWLTTEQLRRRDRIVFQTLSRMGIPVAWNLAGGYQDMEVLLEIHRSTALEAIEAIGGKDRAQAGPGSRALQ